jgi:hypothetical protein
MSDLFETREKTEKGAQWRGEITVTIGGDQQTLAVRQLRDPEFWDVMTDVDTDELSDLQGDLPEDEMEEFRDLQEKDDLDEEEEGRLEELQERLEDEINVFDALSYETYQGIKQAGKYGIVPDQGDIRTALVEHADAIEEEYGGTAEDDAEQYVQDNVINPMIERSTNLASVAIGIKSLGKTLGDAGN